MLTLEEKNYCKIFETTATSIKLELILTLIKDLSLIFFNTLWAKVLLFS